MFYKSIITGSVVTALLIAVLAGARLLKDNTELPDTVLQEIDNVDMSPPEDPPDMDEPEPENEPEPMVEEFTTPIVAALDLDINLPDAPAINASQIRLSAEQSLAALTDSRAPSELPSKPAIRPRGQSDKPTRVTKPTKPQRPTPPIKPKVKESYLPSELDGKPREIRVGRFTWPSRAKGKSGSVRFLLEIDTSGRVRVKRVLSSTDPALVSAAKKVANGSRYTVPKKNGKPVKAIFTKTYQLKKPRR